VDEASLRKQAGTIASILPALMRNLAAPDDDLSTDLPLAQLRLCGILYGGPRPMSSVSRELGVSLSALTQIADRLQRAKLVSRVACGSDRRVRHLRLTERGESLMRLRQDVRAQRVLAVLRQLSPQTREEITIALETLLKTCMAVHGADAVGQATETAESSLSG
jgi:DNA-binding MarR family transcriptional regulator